MRQCVLRKGRSYQVAWIPAKFAVHGKVLRLKEDDGWKVEYVGMYQKKVEERHGYLFGGVGRW